MPKEHSAPISVGEIKRTVATSLGTAFGIVIGMIWTQVVLAGFATAGIPLTTAGGTWAGWVVFIITAVMVTMLCVVAIVLIGRWGSKK
ncbi:MAG: DUF5654 family protein [Candidatus Hadarchaeota archaeon]